MEIPVNSKEAFERHFKTCWSEYLHFKETKDKIVFFIGTLFITVLFGSGFLIFKSNEYAADSTKSIADNIIFSKLYLLQYFLMHLFFLLLYLYYTYNNVQEKTFLIEAQCCQFTLREVVGKIDNKGIPIPVSLVKRNYSDGKMHKPFVKGRHLKDAANVIMFLIYSGFSLIPLFFKGQHIFSSENGGEFRFKYSWVIIGLIGILVLMGVIFTGTQLIKSIKRKILKGWSIPENNSYGI